jgi:hypothetical protein
MKPFETVLRRNKEKMEKMERINLRYFANTYVNTMMYPSILL